MNNEEELNKLLELRKKAFEGGGKERIEKQHQKGKSTARERLDELLDAGSFHEIGQFITRRDDNSEPDAEKIFGDGV